MSHFVNVQKNLIDEAIEHQNNLLGLTPILEQALKVTKEAEDVQRQVKSLQPKYAALVSQIDQAKTHRHVNKSMLRVSEMLERQALAVDMPARLHFTDQAGLVPMAAHAVLEFNLRFDGFIRSLSQYAGIGVNVDAGMFASTSERWLKRAEDNPYYLVPLCDVLSLSDAVYRKHIEKMRVLEFMSSKHSADMPSHLTDEWLASIVNMASEAGFEKWRSARSKAILESFANATVGDARLDISSVKKGTFEALLASVPVFRFDSALALARGDNTLVTAYSNNPFKLKLLADLPHSDAGIMQHQRNALATHSAVLDEAYNVKGSKHAFRS